MTGRPQRTPHEITKLKELGRRIERARIDAGVRSAAEIARNVGVSEASMSAYVRGKQRPAPAILERIAKFLGCPVEYLVGSDAPASPWDYPVEKAFPPDLREGAKPLRLPNEFPSRLGEVHPVALAEIQSAINRICIWRKRRMDAEPLVRLAVHIHDEILEGIEQGGRSDGG